MSPRGRPLPAIGPPRQKGRLKDELRALKSLTPYLWPRNSFGLRVRVVLALVFLLAGKLVNICVPLLYKQAVDALSPAKVVIAVPVALIIAYGLARVMSQGFNELRNAVFAKVSQRAIRRMALSAFRHIHALSLRFHLERRTGGLSRAVERGTAGIDFLLSFMLFNVLPTLFEILLVCGILWRLFNWTFAAVTFTTIVVYIAFTFSITDWRVRFRREMNERNTESNTKAVDSLLNYETVKYFANEEHEARRYDSALQAYERAAVKSETTLTLLNLGQGTIIASRARWGDDLGGRRRRGGRNDGRRLRAGQRLSDPALYAAQLSRHGLSQYQAVIDRPRADDCAPGGQARDRGPARRDGAERSGRARLRFTASISATISGGRSCPMSISMSRPARRSRSSARAEPANRRSRGCSFVSTMSMPARSRSTARTSAM